VVALTYDHVEHIHRFAAWAAARAASRGGTFGTPVKSVMRWTESIGLRGLVEDPDRLPEPDAFDHQHRWWRDRLVSEAGSGLSHGKAAKLIAVYLKTAVVCPSLLHGLAPGLLRTKVGAIHPPVDSILLDGLAASARKVDPVSASILSWKWSGLSSVEYERLVGILKTLTPSSDGPLEFWRLEQHWSGSR